MISSSLSWCINNQPRRIFGWADIINNQNTMNNKGYLDTLLHNLKLSYFDNTPFNYPLTHFLSFVNNEVAGIKWLIYQMVSLSWINPNIRIDYLQGFLNELESLDENFPEFPGSPRTTIRNFLEQNLSNNLYNRLRLTPNARAFSPIRVPTPITPVRPTSSSSSSTFGGAPPPAPRPAHQTQSRMSVDSTPLPQPVFSSSSTTNASSTPFSITFYLQRDGPNDTAATDDVVKIKKNLVTNTYTIIYTSKKDNFSSTMTGVSHNGVLDYVSSMLKLLALDKEPFSHIQYQPPSGPSIIALPCQMNIYDNRQAIYDSMEVIMHSWPTSV
jgi:hypothetical protein